MALDDKQLKISDYNRFGNTPDWQGAANQAESAIQSIKPAPNVRAVLKPPVQPTQPINNAPAANPVPLRDVLQTQGTPQTIMDYGRFNNRPDFKGAANQVASATPAPSVSSAKPANTLVASAPPTPAQAPAAAPSPASAPRPSGAGYSPAGYKINPDYNINNPSTPGIMQFMRDRFTGEGMHYTPQGWVKNAPKAAPVQAAAKAAPTPAPAANANPLSQDQLNSLLPVTKLAGNFNSDPLPDSKPISQMAQQNAAAKTKPAGNTNTKPARNKAPAAQPDVPAAPAPAAFEGDPYESYKARTGIDLANVSHAPVPTYLDAVNREKAQDRTFAPAGYTEPAVETQEQFNQRWALINDFYNSPEGQAVVAARQQGDVVEVQRGDQTSFTDLRNGGIKSIQDYIADQSAKDSALAKAPTDAMTNRELNQLDLLKPKLASETDLAEANIHEAGATLRTNINEAGANKRHDFSAQELSAIEVGIKKGLLSNDPKVKAKAEQDYQTFQKLIPAKYDAKTVKNYEDGMPVSEDLVIYNTQTGQSPTQTAVQNAKSSKYVGKPAIIKGKTLPEGAIVKDGGVQLKVINGVLQLAN